MTASTSNDRRTPLGKSSRSATRPAPQPRKNFFPLALGQKVTLDCVKGQVKSILPAP